MSRQDKATTDRHARILRDLVKEPGNKVCADCKRNDARWSSWNLGVFLCIRCSGIHRGMGTHISRVKSIDLDLWTPEQMDSIRKWGNRRANLWWEAHLKPGHVPPDGKMESYIRSKYETKRWAPDGSPPTDPSVLDNTKEVPAQPATQPTARPPAQLTPPIPAANPPATTITATRSATSQPRALLSTQFTRSQPHALLSVPSPPQESSQKVEPKQAEDDLFFSLNFHKSTVAPQPQPSQVVTSNDRKEEILSLFSLPPNPPPVNQQTRTIADNDLMSIWAKSTEPPKPVEPPKPINDDPFANLWG